MYLSCLQILLGLRDTSDALVASSLRALADLVPYLGGDVVIGGQRKTFFFHGMPKVGMLIQSSSLHFHSFQSTSAQLSVFCLFNPGKN